MPLSKCPVVQIESGIRPNGSLLSVIGFLDNTPTMDETIYSDPAGGINAAVVAAFGGLSDMAQRLSSAPRRPDLESGQRGDPERASKRLGKNQAARHQGCDRQSPGIRHAQSNQ